MTAKRPARSTASGKNPGKKPGKKPQPRGGRRSVREANRVVDTPPRRHPTREARPQRSSPQSSPKRRQRTDGPARPKSASQAKARARARKAKAPKVVRTPLRQRILLRLTAVELDPRRLIARVPFVVLIIAALGAGLGVTLWLSTDAAERSYQLGNAREVNQALIQQKEALERDVLEAQAAPALAEAARNLGMIPSRDTAHLVQDAAGNWVVVGTPKPAEGAPPPPLNTPLADPAPAAPRVAEPLEVPVRIPPVAGQLPVPGAAPGPVQGLPSVPVPGVSVPGVPEWQGVPGLSTAPVAPGAPAPVAPGVPAPVVPELGMPAVPAAPLVVSPGGEVPHSGPGQATTPGPAPLAVPGPSVAGAAPPPSQLGVPLDAGAPQLLPEVAGQPVPPPGSEQFAPVPGAPA